MALWKPLRGNRTALDTVEKHDGWIYFCTDDGSLFFDYTDADGNLQRKQINAKEAEKIAGLSLDELKAIISTQDAVVLHEAQSYTDTAIAQAKESGDLKGDKGDQGEKGEQGIQGEKGEDGIDGKDGKDGADGLTPHIGENGNWWIGDEDTGVSAEGQGGVGGASIIDVIALPTSDIDANATYRVLNGTFVLNKMLRNDSTCHIVEWDSVPTEPGHPVLAEDENSGNFGIRITGYYNTLDDTLYGYFDGASIETIDAYIDYLVDEGKLNSIAAGALKLALSGMTTGWKTMQQILSLVGTAMSLSWGGIITSVDETIDYDTLYLYLTNKMFNNRNGEWISLNNGIGMPGVGIGAEIFNSPDNYASGNASHAEGSRNEALGDNSHAEGYNNSASGASSHVEGDGNFATGVNAHAEGERNTAAGKNAHAEGCLTNATGHHSHTEGYYTEANAAASHASGIGTIANAEAQTVVGRYNVIDATKAFIVGNGEKIAAIGDYIKRSNAMAVDWSGNATFAGDVSSKDGKLAAETYVDDKIKDCATKQYVDESYTIAGKKAGTTVGEKSTIEGFDNTVTGGYSHAEGWNNTVKSNFSHAEGVNVYIEEGADAAHGEGIDIVVEGLYSHAEGYMTSVFGAMAHGEGVGNTVYGDAQHVQGSFSVDDEEGEYLHIVGNGDSDDSRSNAHTIDWSGNAWFSGDIKIGGTGYDDENAKTLATQEFVLNAIREYVNEALLNGRW